MGRNALRSTEELEFIANRLVEQIEGNNSRSNSIANIKPIVRTNGRSADADTLMYAVNLENNNGFVLIAAPMCVKPVLAYVQEGNYGDANCQTNEGFQFFLESAAEYVESEVEAAAIIIEDPNPIIPAFRYDTIGVVAFNNPRVTVTWNQRWPENMYCPNRIAGCGPIAFAQIMSYLKQPTQLTLSYPNHDVDTVTLDWVELNKHTVSTNYSNPTATQLANHYSDCATDEETHKNLARLVREIGHRVSATYGPSSTSTYYSNFVTLALNLYPHYEIIDYVSSNYLYDHILEPNKVAYVVGRDSSAGGHAWVADATMNIKTTVTYYEMEEVVWTKIIADDHYIHYNWGWNGSCNGYFLEGVFNTNEGQDPILSVPRSRYNFSHNIKYFTIKKQ